MIFFFGFLTCKSSASTSGVYDKTKTRIAQTYSTHQAYLCLNSMSKAANLKLRHISIPLALAEGGGEKRQIKSRLSDLKRAERRAMATHYTLSCPRSSDQAAHFPFPGCCPGRIRSIWHLVFWQKTHRTEAKRVQRAWPGQFNR